MHASPNFSLTIAMMSFEQNVAKISTFHTPKQITGSMLLFSQTHKLLHTRKSSFKATETSPWQPYSFQYTLLCR
jgi:hypothetical protein